MASLKAYIAVGAFVDTAVAVTLVILLRRQRSGLRQMNSLIDRVTYSIKTGLVTEAWIYAIGTGLISGPWALMSLIACIGVFVRTPYVPAL